MMLLRFNGSSLVAASRVSYVENSAAARFYATQKLANHGAGTFCVPVVAAPPPPPSSDDHEAVVRLQRALVAARFDADSVAELMRVEGPNLTPSPSQVPG